MENRDAKILYEIIEPINEATVNKDNKYKRWKYGYNEEHDIIVISKDGTIGDIYRIYSQMPSGVGYIDVALPKTPKVVYQRSKKKEEQYWEAKETPKEIQNIKSIFEWDEYPDEFKEKWTPYIEEEFRRRDEGFWFKSNGVDTYITGSHYMYLQWSPIDIGLPDFREANRIRQIHREACRADKRCYGQIYVKIRRSGFSSEESAECVNVATSSKNKRIGIVSKTGSDAKKMFTDKVVPISNKYPFFFQPIKAGMDKPKTEISYSVPSERLSLKKIGQRSEYDGLEGLDTTIDWRATSNNAYDGEKIYYLVEDESGKFEKPENIITHWSIVKTCLRLGKKIVGFCAMGSTVNAKEKGGQEFQDLYEQSNPSQRNKNGQTASGLYALFIPMEWNTEGFIDRYGMPVMETPREPVMGCDGELIDIGAIENWENEVDGLKSNQDLLNEYYRQFPRTIEHAFRDEAKNSLFNLVRIYDQIDFNNEMGKSKLVTRGNMIWDGGVKDSTVSFVPSKNGRFQVTWIPPIFLQNRIRNKDGWKYPANEHLGAFGCDPYDITGTVDGRGSNGSMHGLTKSSMQEGVPWNHFFLRYNARPQTAEIFFEDILKACVFYGMPILAENNKSRLLYHFKKRGYRGYSMNRPDKMTSQLSPTEKEIGGIPSSGDFLINAHAEAIEAYIEQNVGQLKDGSYGEMYFTETLNDFARFNINNRTKHDDSISAGLAIMACNRLAYKPNPQRSVKKIKLNIQRYSNEGLHSEKI